VIICRIQLYDSKIGLVCILLFSLNKYFVPSRFSITQGFAVYTCKIVLLVLFWQQCHKEVRQKSLPALFCNKTHLLPQDNLFTENKFLKTSRRSNGHCAGLRTAMLRWNRLFTVFRVDFRKMVAQ